MIINDNKIYIFDPDYALKRITQGDSCDTDNNYDALKALLKNRSSYELKLKTGDEFNYRERSYHKYPDNIAVLLEKDGVFGLQTFSHSKVGEYFADVLKQSNEVYKFFMSSRGDIIVLESKGGRELSKSYDMLINYISGIYAARKNLEEKKGYIHFCMEKLESLYQEKKYYPDSEMGDLFRILEKKTEEFLDEMQDMISRANQPVHTVSEGMYHTLEPEERNCIAFGLYYGYLKQLHRSSAEPQNTDLISSFMREMHAFIMEHEGIADDYCEYMGYSPYECTAVKQLLQEEGMLRDRWVYAADDLL